MTNYFRLIDEERESNAVAETERRLRRHGKRSASRFQLESIVGIYPTYEQVKRVYMYPLNRLFYSRIRQVQFASMRDLPKKTFRLLSSYDVIRFAGIQCSIKC